MTRDDQYSELSDALGCDPLDSHDSRVDRARRMQSPAVLGRLDLPVRPVRCWYCGQQMHYSGHVAHEPEVRLEVGNDEHHECMYLHTRCWNDWQDRRRVVSG